MSNPCISRVSNEFFIAAALLALFGAAALNNAAPHGPLQIVLALVMGGAGAFLRTGTSDARMVGLGAAALTVAIGGYILVVENGYVVGTIIAVFALFRLWSAGKPVRQQVASAPPTGPMAPFDAPEAHGGGALRPQPPAHTPFYPVYPAAEPIPFFPAPQPHPDDPA